MTSSPFILIPGAALLLCTGLCAWVLAYPRKDALSRELVLLLGCIAGWNLGDILLYFQPFSGWEGLVLRCRSLFPIAIGVLFLRFALRFVRRESPTLSRAFLLVAALAFCISAVTDLVIAQHQRFAWGVTSVPGPLHLPVALQSMVAASCGLYYLLRELLRSTDTHHRAATRLILLGGLVAVGLSLVTEIGLPDLVGRSDLPRLGSPGLAVLCVFLLLAVRRHRFLAVRPQDAAEELFREASDGVLLVSGDEIICQANPAAHRLLGPTAETLVGRRVADVWRQYSPAEADGPSGVLRVGTAGESRFISVSESEPSRGKGRVVLLSDVTLLKQKEEHLRRSRDDLRVQERRLRDILDQLPLGIHSYRLVPGQGLVFEAANAAAERTLGVDHSQYFGMTIEEAFPNLANSEIPQRYREVAETGKTWESEEVIYRDHAIAGAFEVTAFQVAPGRMVAAFRDVTARKQAERVLKGSEERFRSTFEQAAMGIVHAAPEGGRFLRVNRRFCEIVGYSKEELLGLRFLDITHEEDRALDHQLAEQLRAGEIDTFTLEKRYLRKDGETIWAKLTASIHRGDDGADDYFIGVIDDISGQKQVEQNLAKLSGAVAHSPNPILMTDGGGAIEYVNPAFVEATGYSAEDAVGEPLDDLLLPSDGARDARAALWATVRQGNIWRGEVPCGRKQGGTIEALVSVAPVRDSEGAVAHCVAIVQDMTAYRQMEQQLTQTRKLEAVGQLTGGVAHDFNNLLTVIMNNLELLSDCVGDDDLRVMANDALVAAERGAELTNQLLAFSRRQALRPQLVDLNQLVARSVKLLRRTLGDTIEIEQRNCDDLWRTRCDPGQMENALLNLAINARDAMPRGGTLVIETSNAVVDELAQPGGERIPAGRYAVLSLRDSGHGMSPTVLEHVFEPFFTTKEAGRGTGLGLSMVYGFVRQSGGGIVIESEEGKGTCVRLFLPRVERPTRPTDATKRKREELRGGNETILVVEDDPDVRQVAVLTLQRLGYRVLKASDGPAALTVLDEQPRVDLLFTDVMMAGGLSGLELSRIVRERRPAIRILLTTGYSEDVAKGREELEGVEVLPKPFRPMGLAKSVRQILDG